jgi:radical SAM protein with 4Fe4S-binding SPASM domain
MMNNNGNNNGNKSVNNELPTLHKFYRICHKICRNTPLLKDLYSDKYSTYRFLKCKSELAINISKPEFIHWMTTYKCNFHCEHCEASAGDKEKISELDTKEVLRLIAELGEMKIMKIFIGGGEPLLRKDLFIIVRAILDAGMQYELSSNGYLVSEFEEELTKMPPLTFFTSIDGLEKTNDKIRMKGAFNKTLKALEFFKSIGVPNRTVNTVVTTESIGELSELKKFIIDSGVTFWRFSIAIPVGRAKSNDKMFLSDEQLMYLFKFVEETRKEFNVGISEEGGYLGCLSLKVRDEPFFCGAGLTKCTIDADGEVYGCQIAYDDKFSEGNIRDISFKEIWQKGFSSFRYPQLSEECLECKYVDTCRGGCWGMRLENMHCFKRIWDNL